MLADLSFSKINPSIILLSSYIVRIILHVHSQVDVDQDPPEDLDEEEVDQWAAGWHDKVYNEEGEAPDITLGEMLLLYFEWMSVYKVKTCACALYLILT